MFKKIWQWLDGKKLIIAALYWNFVIPSTMFYYMPHSVPVNVNKWELIIGTFFTAIGAGHKVVKALYPDRVQEETKEISDKIN